MPRTISGVDLTELEQIIDRSSVYAVLLAIGRICEEKASHIETNWQNASHLSKLWNRAATQVTRVATDKIGPFGV